MNTKHVVVIQVKTNKVSLSSWYCNNKNLYHLAEKEQNNFCEDLYISFVFNYKNV